MNMIKSKGTRPYRDLLSEWLEPLVLPPEVSCIGMIRPEEHLILE